MIIKTGCIGAGDGPRVTAYAVTQADNERVEIIQDDNDQLLISDEFAAAKGRKNGLLHIIISPGQELTSDELKATIEAIRAEYGFNPADPETLTLHESKRANGSTQHHFHYVRPAADLESGRTYRLFRSNAKDEAVCRLCELKFGHQLTSGPRNDFAELRLREQGHDKLADKLAEAFADEDKPRAAYSHNDHQQARRRDFDLPTLRQSLKELAELPRSEQPARLAELINNNGLELAEAVAEGRGRSRIMIETPEGVKNHNANRTLKIPAAEVAALIHETKEILNDRRRNTPESRKELEGSVETDHRGAGENSPEQSGNDPAPERVTENLTSGGQRIDPEEQLLAKAADELLPQARIFARNRANDLSSSAFEANPDIDDPNLMKKLAAILKRQIEKGAKAAKAAAAYTFSGNQGMLG